MRKSLPLAAMLAAAALGAGATSASAAQISISDAPVVAEGSNGQPGIATFTVTVHRAPGDDSPVEFQYATAPGTAGAADYAIVDTTAVNENPPAPCVDPNGCDETQQIPVTIVPDDLDEPDEVFFMHLTSATMTVVDGDAKATIADDDVPAAAAAPAAPGVPAGTTTTPATPATTYAPTPSGAGAYAAPAAAPAPAVHPAGTEAGDATGPAVGIAFRGLRGRDAKVRVKCPADERRCVGRLSIGLYDSSLASKGFRLKGGESRLLKLRLTRTERRTLRSAGFVYLKASAFDAAGNRFMHAVTEQL